MSPKPSGLPAWQAAHLLLLLLLLLARARGSPLGHLQALGALLCLPALLLRPPALRRAIWLLLRLRKAAPELAALLLALAEGGVAAACVAARAAVALRACERGSARLLRC